MFEAEDNSLRPSPKPRTEFWPRGQLVLEDLASLWSIKDSSESVEGDLFETYRRIVVDI